MKKTIIFLLAFIFFLSPLSAQKSKSVLYMKNGNKIFGKLIEADSSQYKIRTSDGSELIYPVADVVKFTNEVPSFDGRKASGFTFGCETGLLIGPQHSEYAAPFSFNFLAGTTILTKHIMSVGSGVEFIGRPFTPIYIEYKYIMYDRKVSPFIFLRGGGVLPLGESQESSYVYDYTPKNYKGGALVTFGSGISWAKEEYDFNFSFAYRYSHTSYERYEGSRGDVTYTNALNRLELKLGLRF